MRLEPPRDRWLLSFADLLTLLLAFFVVMYSVSAVNETKLSDLATSLSKTFKVEQDTNQSFSGDLQLSQSTPIERVSETLAANLSKEIELQIVKSSGGESAITISLPGSVLFDSGSGNVGLQGRRQLAEIVPLLETATGPIRVEGHTDNVAISSQQFPSNWELSAHRAAATVRFFEQAGLDRASFVVLAYADTQPVGSNVTESGRASNRRIVLKVEALDWRAVQNKLVPSEDSQAIAAKNQGKTLELKPKVNGGGIEQDAPQKPALINLNQDEPASGELQGVDDVDPVLLEQILKSMEAQEN